jgi:hypothetical protein
VLPSRALDCPVCHQLVHSEALEDLAQKARSSESAGDHLASARLWRQALDLLPSESSQAAAIRDRIAALGAASRTAAGTTDKPQPEWIKRLGPLGVVVAFFLKFKTVALLFLTKAKFLLLGLGKLKTLLSMLATIGVYWTLYGWKFAVGFVIGIYIHEMGHVYMLRHYGLRASSPM